MAQRATSLGPKPSLFFVFVFFLLFFVCFFCFFGGFKGQVRWPKGPPHLALNPPYLFFLFFWVLFFSLLCFLCLLIDKKTCFFPLEKGVFCLFSMFLFLSPLTFFGLPFFCFPFSVSLLLFSFYLPSCLSFLLSFSFLFLSLSFLIFLHCFCFMKRKT